MLRHMQLLLFAHVSMTGNLIFSPNHGVHTSHEGLTPAEEVIDSLISAKPVRSFACFSGQRKWRRKAASKGIQARPSHQDLFQHRRSIPEGDKKTACWAYA